MTGAKRSTWIGGTVFVAVVIAVATWFLFVSPTLASAADVRSQAEQTRQQNELLSMKVTKLKADFAKLPEYKAQLAELQKQIPLGADLSAYFLQINKIAEAHSVTITSIAPDTPQTVKLAPAPKPATASSDSSADGSTDSSSASPSPSPSASSGASGASTTEGKAPTVPDGFVAIPFSVTVLGKYADTVAFLHDVQRGTDRLFLVSGLTGTAQKDAAASSGKPATHEGDQELQISGFTYVLNPDLASVVVTAPTPAPTKPALPKPPSSKNPLVPVGK